MDVPAGHLRSPGFPVKAIGAVRQCGSIRRCFCQVTTQTPTGPEKNWIWISDFAIANVEELLETFRKTQAAGLNGPPLPPPAGPDPLDNCKLPPGRFYSRRMVNGVIPSEPAIPPPRPRPKVVKVEQIAKRGPNVYWKCSVEGSDKLVVFTQAELRREAPRALIDAVQFLIRGPPPPR
jgi:hypothetical protein